MRIVPATPFVIRLTPRMHLPLSLPLSLPLLVLAVLLAGTPASGQEFTAADSGWVRIFNGNNFDGLYSRTYGATAPLVRPPAAPYQILDAGTDTAAIRVTTTTNSQQGNIGTDKTSYKHYRVRVQYRFDVQNGNNNAGLTYHTDETAPRMQNNWPRSIESQMKQSETGSAFSIQQVAFTTRTNGTGAGSGYNAAGNTVVQACETGCNGRWYRGNPLVGTHPGWNQMEVVVRGSDSALHIINGTTVMRLWNIRLVNNSGQTISPVDSGGITLQAEGALINYRRWEIMEMPATTPMNAHYLHRLLLDEPAGPVQTANADHSNIRFRWRSIGSIPTVKIEYRQGSEPWRTITESAPNTGSHEWRSPSGIPPNPPTEFRISAADHVWGDSTVGKPVVSVRGDKVAERKALHRIRAGRLSVSGSSGFARMEIRDVSARVVRVLEVTGDQVQWDLTSAGGSRVPSGLYFFSLTGSSSQPPRSGRVMVD